MIICNLDRLLTERGLTPEDIIKKKNISSAKVRKLLDRSAHSIEFDLLEAICDYLECTVGDVLEHSE